MRISSNTSGIVLTAMMMCLLIISIIFFRIPIPFTKGYVHMGDTVVFLSVFILGIRYGTAAAALGGALADLLSGYAMWAPWTLVIKGGMAVILGGVMLAFAKNNGTVDPSRMDEEPEPAAGRKSRVPSAVFGMLTAGIFMTAAYFLAEGIMYGAWAAAALGIPWNIGQFAFGMIAALILNAALCKTPAREFFAYRIFGKTS